VVLVQTLHGKDANSRQPAKYITLARTQNTYGTSDVVRVLMVRTAFAVGLASAPENLVALYAEFSRHSEAYVRAF
jgi:hypothetical protein